MDTKRFHNPEYKKQIRAVRYHKRRPTVQKKESENGKVGRVLSVVGLDSLKRQLLVVFVLALFVYITYFAKFLYLGDAKVVGADDVLSSEIQNEYQIFKERRIGYIFPQKNIIYFNERGFKEDLLKNNLEVSEVKAIKKRPWNKVMVEVVQRHPSFILFDKEKTYLLGDDGFIGEEIAPQDRQDLLVVQDLADEGMVQGQPFIEQQKFGFLSYVNQNFKERFGLSVQRYEVPGRASQDLILYTEKGAKVYFETSKDPELALQRLSSIWSSMNPDEQNRLAYVDLRFEPKAYRCLRPDPCSRNEDVPADSQTNK